MRDTDIAYIAGLFDGEGVYLTNNICKKEKVEKKPILFGKLDWKLQ